MWDYFHANVITLDPVFFKRAVFDFKYAEIVTK